MLLTSPPQHETELLERARALSGMTLGQVATQVLNAHDIQTYHKGWTGQLLEIVLGADAGSLPIPDFTAISVELKTLPIGINGQPRESTFITSIDLLTIAQQRWETSIVYNKLKRVLWITVEGDPTIPLLQRRIGDAILWSPDVEQERVLRQDWQELTDKIAFGQLETISSHQGKYLQIRPKAAHGKSLSYGLDSQGNKTHTLPRGFYLRTSFTRQIIAI